jgi:RNA polymerase sigma-70 factor (ECF subfamily)
VEGLAEMAFRRHHAQIYRYLQRRTGDPDRAEDLAQEVFADATAALLRADFQPRSMLAWLYTIAQRRFADDTRRRVRAPDRLPSDDGLDELPAPESDIELDGALGAAIASLPPGQREVITMKLLRGSSFREVAAAVGVSEPAAKMRFQRALSALRAELEQRGITP